jgi:xanthine dehydrogenase accessory factor
MESTSKFKEPLPVVILRGGGDLASGVALRLHRSGIKLIITELPKPLAVRRLVSFSEAIHQKSTLIEGVYGQHVADIQTALPILAAGNIPILIDPDSDILSTQEVAIRGIVDARMLKHPLAEYGSSGRWRFETLPFLVGLGPGFCAGQNCHAAIETQRGHYLGRVLWTGAPEPNTGIPGKVGNHRTDRVLRAPRDGVLENQVNIGAQVKVDQPIVKIGDEVITAPFAGILRGLLPIGFQVTKGMKIGDLDPRNDHDMAISVSDKSLAIGGGVLEALLTRPEIRSTLWN